MTQEITKREARIRLGLTSEQGERYRTCDLSRKDLLLRLELVQRQIEDKDEAHRAVMRVMTKKLENARKARAKANIRADKAAADRQQFLNDKVRADVLEKFSEFLGKVYSQ